MISTSTTLLRQTTIHPHLLRLMIHIVTATITSLCSLLLHHPLRLMIYTVTAPTTSHDPYRYSNYYVLMLSTVTASTTSLYTTLLQHLVRL